MDNQRLFFSLILSLIVICFALSLECNEHSDQNGVPFKTKIDQSPLVLIGIPFEKNIDPQIRNLFNVTLLVQCILKGRPTERFIHIIQAGKITHMTFFSNAVPFQVHCLAVIHVNDWILIKNTLFSSSHSLTKLIVQLISKKYYTMIKQMCYLVKHAASHIHFHLLNPMILHQC